MNKYLCLNRTEEYYSKWFMTCCTSEVPYLDLFGDMLIGNDKYMLIATTD